MALSGTWLPALLALIALGSNEEQPQPGHIYGETAIDQYLVAQISEQQLRLRVYTDYAEFPGARQRQRFDRSADGLFSDEEMAAWQQQAGIFALRHTRVTIDDQLLSLRLGQTPTIDLYDFPQTGAKPVRESVLLVADLPARPLDMEIATTWQQDRPQHVSRILVQATEPWQVLASEGANQDGLTLAALWRASEERSKPDGFDPTPEYQRRVQLGYGEDLPAVVVPPEDDTLLPSSDQPYSQWGNRLGELLFDRERAVVWWLGLFLAFVYGMGHAFAPGHGKALISAWLLGRKGTVGDAIVAGVAATATHTVMVFVLGIAFTVVKAFTVNHLEALDRWISLAAGAIILGLGMWLLHMAILRLRGIAVGHHHHHHSHDHPHDHDHDHGHAHDHGHHHHHNHRQAGLVGMVAGIAPCPAGILIVVFAAGQQAPALGLLYAFVFSVGMACVLVGIAMAVSLGLRLTLASHPGVQRAMVVIPVLSASAVVVLGIWLAADAAARLDLIG